MTDPIKPVVPEVDSPELRRLVNDYIYECHMVQGHAVPSWRRLIAHITELVKEECTLCNGMGMLDGAGSICPHCDGQGKEPELAKRTEDEKSCYCGGWTDSSGAYHQDGCPEIAAEPVPADSINGPLTDAQRSEAYSLYRTLHHLGNDAAETIIRHVSVRAYLNGRKDFGVEPTPASEALRNEGYDVVCDRRDLFDMMRAAWRDGQSSSGEMDERERWDRATTHATEAIQGWATLRHVPHDNSTAAPVPASEALTDTYCWLVELRPAFEGHPTFPATYYAGWMAGPLEAAKTQDPYASPRFTRKADAERVAKQLGHTLSCTWEAVEHGFHDAAPVQASEAASVPYAVALTAMETLRGNAATCIEDHAKDTYPGATGMRPQDVATMWADEVHDIDAKTFLDEAIADGAPAVPVVAEVLTTSDIEALAACYEYYEEDNGPATRLRSLLATHPVPVAGSPAGVPPFNSDAKCSPHLTQCPRCNNPHHACDQRFAAPDQ